MFLLKRESRQNSTKNNIFLLGLTNYSSYEYSFPIENTVGEWTFLPPSFSVLCAIAMKGAVVQKRSLKVPTISYNVFTDITPYSVRIAIKKTPPLLQC
jgi:hypothetical protein